MRRWRLLLPGTCTPPDSVERAGEAAWNMALDEELFEAVCAGGEPVLRLYLWERPAITLGRFQNIGRTVCAEEVARQEIPMVRRITGGRGILHGADLTICLTASLSDLVLLPQTPISAVYERIVAAYLSGLSRLGLRARMGECTRQTGRDRQGDCFQTVSRADVIEEGTNRKLLGAALHRREEWILQQASLPWRSCGVAASLFQGSSLLGEEGIGHAPSVLCTAVCDAFVATMGLSLQASALLASERRRAEQRSITRYLSTEWTQGRLSSSASVEIDS